MKKGQTRLEGFDEKILALYARGMTTRDIEAPLQELSGVEVSPTLISNVTEAVIEEVRQWQSRPLEAISPIVSLDCLLVKVKENQRVSKKAVYLALGGTLNGNKERLWMWLSANEGARFWLAVLTELQNRGVKDLFIACVEGLTGFVSRHGKRLSTHAGAALYGSYGQKVAALRVTQAHASGGHGLEGDFLWSCLPRNGTGSLPGSAHLGERSGRE